MAQPQASSTSPAPPAILDSLPEAYRNPHGQTITVMGVVTDVLLPPVKTKSGDWMLTCTISDPDLVQVSTRYNGMKVRAFNGARLHLPRVRAVGDVILLRNVNVTIFGGLPTLMLDKHKTSYVVFPGNGIPDTINKLDYQRNALAIPNSYYPAATMWAPSAHEQMTAIVIKQKTVIRASRSSGATASGPVGLKQGEQQEQASKQLKKFSLIEAAACNSFYDVVVEVVKIYPGQFGGMEIYVTDYTTNSLLYDYPAPEEEDDGFTRDGDQFGLMPVSKREWPGPYGSMVLKVEVKEPHASTVRNLMKEGDFICIQNLRLKLSNQGKMEGNLWPDSRYPEKILLHRHAYLNDAKVHDIKQRKDQYWLDRQQEIEKKIGKQLTKGQKRKRREKEKRAAAVAAVETDAEQTKPTSASEPGLTTNKYIRCMKRQDIKLSSLNDLINPDRLKTQVDGQLRHVPFILQKRRIQIRVVDFCPSTLEGFAEASQIGSSSQWRWSFTLLVENGNLSQTPTDEERCQMWVQVHNADAQGLLDLDASDLTSDKATLAKLREKLAILWGNLEERKAVCIQQGSPYPPELPATGDKTRTVPVDVGLSNLPFESCIQEYGQKDPDPDNPGKTRWDPMYSMFGVTIK